MYIHACAHSFLLPVAATIFYNISLAVYYHLVIVLGWKERQLKRVRFLLHGIPVAFGFALAFTSLGHYSWHPAVCFLPVFPLEDVLHTTLGLLVVPVCVSLLILSVLLFTLYWKVREQCLKMSKFHYGKVSIQQKVFVQSVSYLVAFLVAWPVIVVSSLQSGVQGPLPYWQTVLTVLLSPCQGFMNALVYFRPRQSFKWSCCTSSTKTERPQQAKQVSEGAAHFGSVQSERIPSERSISDVGAEEQPSNIVISFHSLMSKRSSSGRRLGDEDGVSRTAGLQSRAASYDPSVVIACDDPRDNPDAFLDIDSFGDEPPRL